MRAAVTTEANGALDASIATAARALCGLQRADGHFIFELEADATIPAEYVLMRHYRGEPVDAVLEAKIARYLRRIQSADGGWPLFHAGTSDISASVKAYFALKMIGDPIDAPHMARARAFILGKGGAANSNVFTRNLLALYGAIPWRGVPVMPVEIMLLPRWFPFHLDKVSYWARTVLVPLTVLNALKPRAVNAKAIGIDELFVTPPNDVRHWPKGAHQTRPWAEIFGGIDRALHALQPYFPQVDAQAGDRARRRFRHRAAERRERARRDLSGDGECAADVRRARIWRRRSEGSHGESRDRGIARGQCGRGLLPALPVTGVGYGARGARFAGGRRRGMRAADVGEPRMAASVAGLGYCRRLGIDASGRSPRRLGLPIRQSALSRSRRYGCRGHGHGPHRWATS